MEFHARIFTFVLLAKSKYSSGLLYVLTTIDYHLSGCVAAIIVR